MPAPIIVNGVERFCGLLPSPAATIARMHREGTIVFASDHPRLKAARPGADFEDRDCSHFWKYRHDQDGTSECVGHSGAHAISTAFAKEGFDIDINPVAVYAPICGGSDNGANMADALDSLQKYGAFPMGYGGISDTDWRTAYRTKFWQHPQESAGVEAAKYKIIEAVFFGDDVDAWLAALDTGFWSGQFGLGAGRNFEPDESGSLPPWDRTGINHALFATGGMRHHPKTGKREVEAGNSWGDWGPLNGLFYFDPYDWLPHSGQELWTCRSTTIPA